MLQDVEALGQLQHVNVTSAEQRAAVEERWSQLFRPEGRPAVVEPRAPVGA